MAKVRWSLHDKSDLAPRWRPRMTTEGALASLGSGGRVEDKIRRWGVTRACELSVGLVTALILQLRTD
jgi:hypothetical protein